MNQVVVTGVGVVSPIGSGKEGFLAGLRSGRSGSRIIERFPCEGFPNRIAAEVSEAELAPLLERIAPEDRAWLANDRKALLAAAAIAAAVEDAGGIENVAPFARGVSFGPGENTALHRALDNRPGDVPQLSVKGVPWHLRDEQGHALRLPFDAPTRWAAERYGFRGPQTTNVGACAAGAMAIGEAFRLIRRGGATVMLAGGFDSMINPMGVMSFSLLGALSGRHDDPEHASRPFDRTRDGFVPGEGAGILVLEALEHALERKARIYGEIVGYGASMDAYRPTAPSPEGRGAALAMRRAMEQAGWSPEDVGYINAHGTSTPLNDATETQAIKAALGSHAYRIPVSSTKSQIGHLVAGAGAVELIGSLLAMEAGFVPPTLNLRDPDPECDLDYVPGASRAHAFDTLLSNSFAFGGQNACLAACRYPLP